jgi:hypothetical protein
VNTIVIPEKSTIELLNAFRKLTSAACPAGLPDVKLYVQVKSLRHFVTKKSDADIVTVS